MHLEKPTLARYFLDPALQGYARLQKLFFAPTASSQAAGEAFVDRLAQRRTDRDLVSGPEVAAAQIANAVLLTYPDSGHGALFQFHESFTRQAEAFLNSNSQFALYGAHHMQGDAYEQ